ncbi:SDR family oxidoreductase [Saccharopolyspora sp. SCSIO 74807]|uniref:SDR family oxidoreductase n=1 Tax=Saccharopolyspora sp. SCSIO 74807 TaxID=3118084 RepID=UPI0030CF661B
MAQQVAVIIGSGGIGSAIARRLGPEAHLLIADHDRQTLHSAATELDGARCITTTAHVDVGSPESVTALARQAASLGEVGSVVHTAGLSPVQADVSAVLTVDLLGVALVIEEFAEVIAPGGAGVVIASMAAHGHPGFAPELAGQLATAPAAELLSLPVTDPAGFADAGHAYSFAKRANLLRVQAASRTWGANGARINSISPGIIETPMGRAELAGRSGPDMRAMIAASNAGRPGTATEIAEAAAFLLGPAASFISGTDLLVDGGAVAAFS